MAVYSKFSPYYNTSQANGYLDIATWRSIPAEADDVLFTVDSTYMHRPDLLSYDFYQTAELWWVFAVRNPSVIKDPVYDMVPGISIYIPKINTLKAVLGF